VQIPARHVNIPQAFDCHIPDTRFLSKYMLPVSQTKRHAEEHAHEGLEMHTATVVWLKSVPWLDLVGLVGVGLVGVGLVGVGLVGVGLWEWACGHYFVGVGSWALICGNGLVKWFVEVGQELSGNQIRLLELCSMALQSATAVISARRERSEAVSKS
jgi:hypothetical protein